MDLKISGKSALITGGSGGFGMETARVLRDEGVDITLTDVDEDALKEAADSLGVKYQVADLSTQNGVKDLFDAVGTGFDI